jgi:hypothetical protein
VHEDNLSFKVSPQAVASIHDDGIVILHTPSGRIYTSNTAGARIWTAIERHLHLESIADEISAAYQITRTTAREHAQRFLSELERNSLVQREIPL